MKALFNIPKDEVVKAEKKAKKKRASLRGERRGAHHRSSPGKGRHTTAPVVSPG